MRKLLSIGAVTAGMLLVAGCGSMPPAEPAQDLTEQVTYMEGQAQAFIRDVDQLSCYAGWDAKARLCVEPGKPIAPTTAVELLLRIKDGRQGLRAALGMPAGGGACLPNAPPAASPLACLQSATQLLLEVEHVLRQAQQPKGN